MFSIVFLFSYCGGNGNNSSATSTSEKAPLRTISEGSYEADFCKLWVIKHAVGVDDLNNYRGRWFNLKNDGTFENGQWGETTNGGTWSIEGPTSIMKFVFSTPESIPSNWQIQGKGSGGRILFKGNVPGNERGLQVMLDPENVLPVQEK